MVNIIKNFGDWKMIKESEILNSKFQEILSISNLKIIPLGNTEKIEFSKIKDSELWRKMAKRDWILGKYENTKDFQTFLGDYVEWYQIEKSGGKYNIFQGFLIKFENKIGFVKCRRFDELISFYNYRKENNLENEFEESDIEKRINPKLYRGVLLNDK